MDLKLCYNTFKFKEGENLTQTFTIYKALMNELVNDGIKLSKLEIKTRFINGLPKKWLNSLDDEEDTRGSQEYMNDLEMEFHERTILSKSKRFFKKGTQRFSGAKATNQTKFHKCGRKCHFARDYFSKTLVPSYSSPVQINPQPKFINSSHQHKPELRPTKDFKAKYNKVKAKLALLSAGALTSKSSQVKNQSLITEAYEWDEEEVSSDDNKMVDVKVFIALANDESGAVGKESSQNGEWVKISMGKVHTLFEMKDNDERKYFLDYLCIGLNFVEEQRNNLVIKHRDIIQELNTCKEKLLELKQAKLDFLTMQHVNTEIIKANQNLRKELKELTEITDKHGLTVLTRPWLSKTEGFNFPNRDTSSILPYESQVKVYDSSVNVTDSSVTNYDSAEELSSVCSTPLHSLEKLAGVEPVYGPKTIKSILKSCSANQKGFVDEYVKSRWDERSLLICTPPRSRTPMNQAMVVGDGLLAREAPSSSSSSLGDMNIHGYDRRRLKNGVTGFSTITSGLTGLFQSKWTHDSFNDIVDAIVKMRVKFHERDVSRIYHKEDGL
uniref:Retrovirus-related Pol polyprotein from transposon TNT 1-94 n=1 Tax=Tanacetum cinerariifolium TaxID=118510 RepID=A0A6L2LQG2_TANCI|nr:hypothetical protein [Tanacetum cinerariifolium]